MICPERIDRTWTLFLDRDGVVNVYLPDDYVKNVGEFAFVEGAPEALRDLSKVFGRIVIVTNQRGIARGIMSEDDLTAVHEYMLGTIRSAGGRIDGIFHCPHDRNGGCDCRKPLPGLALQAKRKFPEIDFAKSIMLGDSFSDMELGKSCGMELAYIPGHDGPVRDDAQIFASLADFSRYITGSPAK
jgi:D-glycero-D-manno-heptose 1,7-bisphosphate phosphatase